MFSDSAVRTEPFEFTLNVHNWKHFNKVLPIPSPSIREVQLNLKSNSGKHMGVVALLDFTNTQT